MTALFFAQARSRELRAPSEGEKKINNQFSRKQSFPRYAFSFLRRTEVNLEPPVDKPLRTFDSGEFYEDAIVDAAEAVARNEQ